MKKLFLLLLIIIIPAFGYEVFYPDEYSYNSEGNMLLFVVDFSNSMSEYLEYKTKANHAKEAIANILPLISADTQTGLRVYGHTCNMLAYNACRSSELVVPLGYNSANDIVSEINLLRPRGMTPITYSLKQAVKKDFKNDTNKKHIILLTDGGENCDESPCDYAIELMKQRRDIKIDVIAFDVHDGDDLAQLRCTADVTGGAFTEASTKAELMHSMQNMVTPHKKVEAVIVK